MSGFSQVTALVTGTGSEIRSPDDGHHTMVNHISTGLRQLMVMGIENEAQAVAVRSHPVHCDWEMVCFDSFPTTGDVCFG